MWTWFLLVVGFSLIGISVWKGYSRDLFHPLVLFGLLYSTKYLVRPFILMFDLDTPATFFLLYESPAGLAVETFLLQTAGVLAFVLGCGRKSQISSAFENSLPSFRGRGIRKQILEICVIGALGIAAMTILYFIAQTGSVTKFMVQARTGILGSVGKKSIPVAATMAGFFMVVCLRDGQPRQTIRSTIYVGCGLILLFLINDRNSFVYGCLVVMIGYHFCIRRISSQQLLALLIFGLVSLNIMTFFRAELRGNDNSSIQEIATSYSPGEMLGGDSNPYATITHTLNADTFDHFMVITQDYDSVGDYHWGRDFYRGLIGVIPRAIWPGKPDQITTGSWFRAKYYPSWTEGGRPIGVIGEWYLNFGILGILFGCFFSGNLLRAFYDNIESSGGDPRAAFLYIIAFLYLSAWGVVTVTTAQNMIFWLVPFSVLFLLIRKPGSPNRRERAAYG